MLYALNVWYGKDINGKKLSADETEYVDGMLKANVRRKTGLACTCRCIAVASPLHGMGATAPLQCFVDAALVRVQTICYRLAYLLTCCVCVYYPLPRAEIG